MEKPKKKPSRRSGDKQVQMSVQLSKKMLEAIDEFAEDASRDRMYRVNRAEAVRDLVQYSLARLNLNQRILQALEALGGEWSELAAQQAKVTDDERATLVFLASTLNDAKG